jgi:hypothetical protein
MTRREAETKRYQNGPSSAGPASEPELDRLARLNAQLLPVQPGLLEADRHGYPCPPERIHRGMTPTGGEGGGLLHERLPTRNGRNANANGY